MRRLPSPLLIWGCFLALTVACFGTALFRGGQFSYRDAGHYYYPLYRLVQSEWEAGRWPLWDPGENGGVPLLGNPTAAVLYPGKLIYALFPYPWAARLYIVAHTGLAFAAMLALMRSWGTSWTGSGLSALAYAFGGPVLFQYCNVIYLVGAAWLPLGFRAVDRWLRLGRRVALVELAVVLALQTLGGDPETAFVTGLCAGGYAVGLACAGMRWPLTRVGLACLAGGAVALWVAGTLAAARWLPGLRPDADPPAAFSWMVWVHRTVAAAWGCAGLYLLLRWVRRGEAPLARGLAGLAGAAGLAAALAAVQLLPVREFTAQSARATSGGANNIYPFSIEPIRLIEFACPNVFGSQFRGNRSWLIAAPGSSKQGREWTASLYLGALTLALAFGGAGFRGGPAWRTWLTAVAGVSLLACLGECTGPLWWARWVPSVASKLGAHDPIDVLVIRVDGQLRDGDGGFYWALATLVPGFREFRYPGKLLTFTALAVSALAGLGWDRLCNEKSKRAAPFAAVLVVLCLIAVAAAEAHKSALIAAIREGGRGHFTVFGPLDAVGAFSELSASLLYAAMILALSYVLLQNARGTGAAGPLALMLLTCDLAYANARLVLTVAQADFDAHPVVARAIEDAERDHPTPGGPFRVHRMPFWNPLGWYGGNSTARPAEIVRWERDTIIPKYGLTEELQYTLTLGAAELYDYAWFFGGFTRPIDAETAKALKATPGQRVVVMPRRAYDLWGTRYFVVPMFPRGWQDPDRGYAAFIDQTDRVFPPPELFEGEEGPETLKAWIVNKDVQILRNKDAYPRAWVVHAARFEPPTAGVERSKRDPAMDEMLYPDNPLWHDRGRTAFDPHRIAWLESDQQGALAPYLPGPPPSAAESVTVSHYGPQRVELDAVLDQPGIVILADVYYPGWGLTVDGADAPIYRVNRLMRGAAVRPGKHHLVYRYEPASFLWGGRISGAAATLTAVLLFLTTVRLRIS